MGAYGYRKELFLTITNSHAREAVTVKVDILGGVKVNEARGQILTGEIHAHNTFSSPTLVTPQVFDVSCGSSQLNLTIHSEAENQTGTSLRHFFD